MRKALLYLWQLPQLIVSLLMIAFYRKKPKRCERCGMSVFRVDVKGRAFSLGPVVFCPEKVHEEILKHEIGHSYQSLYLGPLYLLIVGLPSVLLYLRYHLGHHDSDWYHSRYPEKWADDIIKKKQEV